MDRRRECSHLCSQTSCAKAAIHRPRRTCDEKDCKYYIIFAPPALRAFARAYALSMRLDNATGFDFSCHDPSSEQTVRDLKAALHEIASEHLQHVVDKLDQHLKKFRAAASRRAQGLRSGRCSPRS